MGQIANVQQLRPEIVIGYIVLFDTVADSRRQDGTVRHDLAIGGLRSAYPPDEKWDDARLGHLKKSSRP
jgi:hypothetical protein